MEYDVAKIIIVVRVVIVRIDLVGFVIDLLGLPSMKALGPRWGVQYTSRSCRCSYTILSLIAPWDAFAKEN